MSEYAFEGSGPVELVVELGRGSVRVRAAETTGVEVRIEGRGADQVQVEQHGRRITVIAPRHRHLFGGDPSLHLDVTVPEDSDLAIRTGSADVTVEGRVGSGRLRSGSGDLRVESLGGPGTIESGSGDVRIDAALGDVRVKSGSGEVELGRTSAAVVVSTGSGDVTIAQPEGPTSVKTGSGDLVVQEASADVALSTGSGDLAVALARRGRITVHGASGDVRVGVPEGLPVWTDITTVSGEIRSGLTGAGEPAAGQDHLEVRATTVSGDVVLVRA